MKKENKTRKKQRPRGKGLLCLMAALGTASPAVANWSSLELEKNITTDTLAGRIQGGIQMEYGFNYYGHADVDGTEDSYDFSKFLFAHNISNLLKSNVGLELEHIDMTGLEGLVQLGVRVQAPFGSLSVFPKYSASDGSWHYKLVVNDRIDRLSGVCLATYNQSQNLLYVEPQIGYQITDQLMVFLQSRLFGPPADLLDNGELIIGMGYSP
ncbi:hypothetical protein JW868_04420 [Candidatus Woesearchaeota archaeon]|nr:hypothetical protein [Candidatus Woesearchaeota archaeon]